MIIQQWHAATTTRTVTHSHISSPYWSPDVCLGIELLQDIQFGLPAIFISYSYNNNGVCHECIYVIGSGHGIPKIFRCTSRASGWTSLSKFLNPPLITLGATTFLKLKEKLDVFEAKIEESEKAGSRRESNPGHLAWAASGLPLSYDNRTTPSPHNPLYILHRWYWSASVSHPAATQYLPQKHLISLYSNVRQEF